MASIRKRLLSNENDSKNTRMDIGQAMMLGNFRPDEIAHCTRYDKICSLMIEEAKEKGPLDLLEAGVGECWPLRYLYKAYTVKKSDVVDSYLGVDIDPICTKEHPYWPNGGGDIHQSAWFQIFSGKVVIQDLTTNPEFPCEDGSIDFFYTTEVIEHMGQEFVEPWIESAHRKLRKDGLAFVSTPNHDGSNDKLPEDHVYEWRFQELKNLLRRYFIIEAVTGTFIQLPNFNRAQTQYETGKLAHGWEPEVVEIMKQRYGRQFLRVALAAPYPEFSNNCSWILRKK